MKKQAALIVLLLLPLTLWRCGKEADYDVPKQDSTFRQFLNDAELPYDATLADQYGLYKVVWPYRENGGAVAALGDQITISYSGYTFAKTPATYGQGTIYTSNIEFDAVSAGWRVPNELMPLDPVSFTLGSGQILRGIDLGLEGCTIGDTVRLYLPSNLAYGGDPEGFISAGTPVVFKIYIEDIVPRQ